jgi:hypothetical protein
MAKQSNLNPPAAGSVDPALQELLDGQQPAAGSQENGGSAGTQEQPKPTPIAPKPKANEGKGTGNVTFYTRVGMPFDPKTGKERPCKKHVVTRSWWLVNKSRLARLGYNLIKVEGE